MTGAAPTMRATFVFVHSTGKCASPLAVLAGPLAVPLVLAAAAPEARSAWLPAKRARSASSSSFVIVRNRTCQHQVSNVTLQYPCLGGRTRGE